MATSVKVKVTKSQFLIFCGATVDCMDSEKAANEHAGSISAARNVPAYVVSGSCVVGKYEDAKD